MPDSTRTITLVNPNLVLQANDMFATGIVYMPVSLAYFAGSVRQAGYSCKVIDAFGEKPSQWWKDDQFIFRGLSPAQVVDKIEPTSAAVILYAINITYHHALVQIIREIRVRYPLLPL